MSDPTWDGLDLDGTDEETKFVDWGGKDGIVFLIEATKAMFNSGSDCYFQTALKCCRTTMVSKMIGSAKDCIGIVLFGTDVGDNKLNAKHVSVLQNLEQPDLDRVKKLDTMINSDTFDNFENTYGHCDDFAMESALWVCTFLFSNCPVKLAVKRIVLLTCVDQPSRDGASERQRVRERCAVLQGLGVDLELLGLGPRFNPDLYYKELVEAAVGEQYAAWAIEHTAERLDELLSRDYRAPHKLRSQVRVPLHLTGKRSVGVGVYSVMVKRQSPSFIWLDKKSNEELHSVVEQFDKITGERIHDSEVQFYKEFGREKICFDHHELKKLKEVVKPGFYLMGFEAENSFKLHYHFRKPLLLLPTEGKTKGVKKDARLFTALAQRCAEQKMVAMCWGRIRSSSGTAMFALVPATGSCEPQDAAGAGSRTAPIVGFNAFCLPTSRNVRNWEFPKLEQASSEQIKLMGDVVDKLTARYDPYAFNNPQLHSMWANIEALALELTEVPPIVDNIKPKYDVMKTKLGDLSERFSELFDCEPPAKSGAKRAANAAGSGRPAKAVKNENVDVLEMVKMGQAEKLKVDQLKAFLMEKGRRVTGKKKSDLLDMLKEEVEEDI